MKLLLHICCAPCAIYPVATLRGEGLDVMGFFYRHNIHPFSECLKREETLKTYSDQIAAIGEAVGRTVGVPFVYRDFRSGWKAGIEASRQLGLYRQQYCGCIYSEKDRFYHPPKT